MPNAAPLSPLKLIATALYLCFWPALVFLLAGTWRWLEGWLFCVWFVAFCATCMVWLYRKDPELLAERYRLPGSGGQKAWDQVAVYVLAVGFLAWIVLPPLDVKRFGWTPRLPLPVTALGGLLLLPSSFLFFRAFTDNHFLSPLVRIQSERQQRVVSTGVYGFVRHPMYLGALLMFLGAPLLLGSAVGLLVGVLLSLGLAGRIIGEERLLVSELDGYEEYRHKVRHRLIPFVW